MITSGMLSSKTPEWATPQGLFDELNAEFHFNLDPCSTHENAKCEKHYTKEDDGLSKSWGAKSILQSSIWQRAT
jgi:site-specific DNA-methyltransferase (adenine-specific)